MTSSHLVPVQEASQKYTLNDIAQELTNFSCPSVCKLCHWQMMGKAWKMKLRRLCQLGFRALMTCTSTLSKYIYNLIMSIYLKHIRSRSLQEHQTGTYHEDGEAHWTHLPLLCLGCRSITHRINWIKIFCEFNYKLGSHFRFSDHRCNKKILRTASRDFWVMEGSNGKTLKQASEW